MDSYAENKNLGSRRTRICYFGDHVQDYTRHKILKKGLEAHGFEVIERNTETRTAGKYLELARFVLEERKKTDIFFVAYSISRYVWFIRLLTRKPIVWDAFYSLYDNWVFDRKIARPRSLKALYYWSLDWTCCLAADLITLDSYASIEYFVRTFRIKRRKFVRVLVGADLDVMRPLPRPADADAFTVFFYGRYIPVQGADVIVRAAKLLEGKGIRFVLLGAGQEYKNVRKLAEELGAADVEFLPQVRFGELPGYIARADVCLGLFGDVPRVDRSIPNKVYECAAMGKACINADTSAVKEFFVNRESILVARRGDPRDLADKIMELKEDPELRARIGQGALKAMLEKAGPEKLLKDLASRIKGF